MPALLINGVDAASLGLTLAEAPGWLDAPQRQTPTAPIIGRGGAKILATPAEQPRRITLRGTVCASSVSVGRSRIDALKMALLADPLSLTFADHSDRHINATLESFTAPQIVGPFVQESLAVEAVLTAYDPLSYDNDLAGVIQWYQPGDTITGENFSRATVATYIANSGTLATAAVNEKRDNHWPGGVGPRSLLLEGARTNSVLWSRDATNGAWVKTGCTAAKDTTGVDGAANSASTLTATATGANARVAGAAMGAGTVQTIYGFVKAGGPTGGWAWAGDGGDAVWHRIWINLSSAAIGTMAGVVSAYTLQLAGGWIYWTVTYVTTNAYTALIYSGMATADNNFVSTAGDQLRVDIVGHERDTPFASSPIITTSAPVTRAADSYSLPGPPTPKETTIYAQFTEGGTLQTGAARLFQISSAGNAPPQFLAFMVGGGFQTYHDNNAGGVAQSASPGVGPAIRQKAELMSRLYADGSVDTTQSINGAAATASPRTVPAPLAPAWSDSKLWLNSDGAVTVPGFTSIQSIKVAVGARSLDDMRALLRMPLGTGPVRPIVTITGACVNPVIALYNKAGVVVASLTLTITNVGGDVLVIDMDAKTVKKNGVSVISAISAGDFFPIDPADQANFGVPGPRIDSSSGATSVAYYRTWR